MIDNQYANIAYDIVVLAGQSNAEGYGRGDSESTYEKNENVQWLFDKSNPHFEKSEDGKDFLAINYTKDFFVETAEEKETGKLSLFFAKRYIEAGLLQKGRRLLIVNAAVGGTGFARKEWGLGSPLYARLLDMTKAALGLNKENKLVAFLWHQGEHDASENADWDVEKRYTAHRRNLEEQFSDFEKQFQCEGLPFIAGGFCDEWYLKNQERCNAILQAIREVLALRNGAFVETAGLLSNNQKIGNEDEIHFCRDSLHVLGERYFEAYKKLIKA